MSQPSQAGRRLRFVFVGVIVVAAIAVYANTLRAPFIFDDINAIENNPTIKQLWPPWRPLLPPQNATGAGGRPLVNLSLAVNHTIGGLDVRGYHVFNLGVHIGCALLLFGIMRRTLVRPTLHDRWGTVSVPVAGVAALLWTVHPLATESVTCVIQRSESIGGFFFLLTVYGFVRSLESAASARRWRACAVGACLLGVVSKEYIIAAPLFVLLYDRTLEAGTWRDAWRERRNMYLGFLGALIALAGVIVASGQRGGTVGFGLGMSSWHYLLTQCKAIVLYLRLACWPDPLVLDYGTETVRQLAVVWPQALLLVALSGATVWGVVRRSAICLLGVWFFAILAPSSSFVPLTTQTMAEHRMYLPLAALVVGLVMLVVRVGGARSLAVCGAIAVGLGWMTIQRNKLYGSALVIWADTLEKRPDNVRAHLGMAIALDKADRLEAANEHYRRAIVLMPDHAGARYNLAYNLVQLGRVAEAIPLYEESLRLESDRPDVHMKLGEALMQVGRLDDAVVRLTEAVRLWPDDAGLRYNLAEMLAAAGRSTEAVIHYREAIRHAPGMVVAHLHLGNTLARSGEFDAAEAAYREAIRLDPQSFQAHANLGGALVLLGRPADAIPVYEIALRLKPGDPRVTANLAEARAMLGL